MHLTKVEIHYLAPCLHLPAPGSRYRMTAAERDTPQFIRQSRNYAELLRKFRHSVSFDLQHGKHYFDTIITSGAFLSSRTG